MPKNLEIIDVNFWSPNEFSQGGMRVEWSSSMGFGQMDFVKLGDENNYQLTSFTEYMGEELVNEIFQLLLKQTILGD